MKKYFLIMMVLIVSLSLTGVVSAADKDAMKDNRDEVVSTFEERGYVFRTKLNEALQEKAQDFCDAAFPEAMFVGGFDWYSINTKGADGSVVNWAVKKVAEDITCSVIDPDAPSDAGTFLALVRVTLGHRSPTTLLSFGTCQITNASTPEDGLFPITCRLNILPEFSEGISGLLTTNSLTSITPNLVTELGYRAGSIATLRIYLPRDEDGDDDDDD